MSSAYSGRRLPVLATIVAALILTAVPLPDRIEPFRPDWVVLTLIYWAMMLPRRWSVGSAWLTGIFVDVMQGTMLGQHALALAIVIYVTVRFHLLMRVFPLQQLTATVFALIALYQFLLFWINGVAGVHADAVHYWAPVVTGTILWPLATVLLSGIRARA